MGVTSLGLVSKKIDYIFYLCMIFCLQNLILGTPSFFSQNKKLYIYKNVIWAKFHILKLNYSGSNQAQPGKNWRLDSKIFADMGRIILIKTPIWATVPTRGRFDHIQTTLTDLASDRVNLPKLQNKLSFKKQQQVSCSSSCCSKKLVKSLHPTLESSSIQTAEPIVKFHTILEMGSHEESSHTFGSSL